MLIFLIGGYGFVGSAFARLLGRSGHEFHIITRQSWSDFRGMSCDVLINANGNSKKFMADRDPKWEFDASVASVVASLADFKSSRYVLLSTGDVYPSQDTPDVTGEDQEINKRELSRYGLHKRVAEEIVQAVHPSALVMRMGGFVGPGLKKNAIYDILNGPEIWLHPDSELQFISTDRAAELVWRLVELGVTNDLINLGARGVVRIGDIQTRVGSKVPFASGAKRARFELNLAKLERLCGSVPKTADEVAKFLDDCGHAIGG
jgi:nucleoside-diphosphate-sugar epimerase